MKFNAGDSSGLLPPVGVVLTLMECTPSVSSEPPGIAWVQIPSALAVVVPMDVEPSNSSTVLLAAADPVNVGVLLVLNPLVFIVPSAWSRVGIGVC